MSKMKTRIRNDVAAAPASNKFWSFRNEDVQTGELLLYGTISESSWWDDEVTPKQFNEDLHALGDISTLNVRVNSGGGDVFAGQAIHSLLKRHKATVNVYIDGLAASIASVIAMAGDKIIIPKNAMMMIHNPWTWAMGDANDMREMADTLDKVRESIVAAYMGRSTMTKTRDELIELMNATTWMTGQEAVDMGFADEVEEKVVSAALNGKILVCNGLNFDMSRFNRLPTLANNVLPVSNPVAAPAADKNNQGSEDDVIVNEIPVVPNNQPAQVAVVDAVQAETNRVTEILNICQQLKNVGVELNSVELISNKTSVEDARKMGIDALAAKNPTVQTTHVEVGAEDRDKFMAAATDAIAIRGNVKVDKPAPGAAEMRGMQLKDLCREVADRCGVKYDRYDTRSVVKAALSTSDFPQLTANVARKSMMTGYQLAPVTYPIWTKRGSLADFKPAKRIQLSELSLLRKISEGGEYKYQEMAELGQNIQLAKYGDIFSLTYEAIINDDLQALTDIPQKWGAASALTVEVAVYLLLNSNPTMYDGKPLFHADHGNLGTAAAITVASISDMEAAMALQTGIKGEQPLNINPSYLLTPVKKKTTARQLIASTVDPSKNNGTINPYNNELAVVASPQLDKSSATAWYGAAAPGLVDTVEVSFLDGVDAPHMEMRQGFEVDGVDYKVRFEFGAQVLDFRGLFKNPGA